MTTDEALHLLSLRLDAPLSAEQQSALDTWLAARADHRILAEAFAAQHTDLQTTFEPRRVAAQQTATAVLEQLNPPQPATPKKSWRAFVAAPLPAACAAALLLAGALYLFHKPTTHTPKPVEVAEADTYGVLGMKPRAKPAAPKATTLAVGESLSTKAGEKRRVVLPDGSIVYLNQNTTIELPKDRQVKLVTGDVFVEAIPANTKPDLGQFLVETPKRSVTALGTMFAVSASKEGTGVLVTQGKVEVSGLDTKLTTGQELLPNDKIVASPRVATALEWTRDLMVAAESPLVPAGKYSGGSLVAVDPYGQEAKLALVKFHVDVHIEDGFARTTIDQTYFNSENRQMEGTFYFPLPPDASLSRLAMYVEGDRMEGGMAEREHARDVYETIRHQRRDPALLEWVDGSVFKMRVFPLEARQEKRIILSYTQKLPVVYGTSAYRFPAGHSLAIVNEWSFHAFVKDGASLAASVPSHPSMKLKLDGKNLRITDKAANVKVDQDVVLTLTNHAEEAAWRWNTADHDGQKYLMLRYRPDLPTTPKRERRDWVFLFESSGGRDPLVARTQVEVIRALLTRAEHDDTFSILRVGTRVRTYAAAPLPATIENVQKALTWLDSAHLIGALNLDQAFSDATPLLQRGSNPHLVHVGGGIASIGEQRADELVKRIPAGTKYVGVAVGKRFSPALMKTAAEKTGGLFTQINPDESMSWRGFELASTLNAPRLLNVKLESIGAVTPRFLTFSNIVTHGEELAAVANVTGGLPTMVRITGLLDGQPWERSVRLENLTPGADYLPRTWAKLEIDRLLADNSQNNKKAIIDLSKAMYVMTPYTSLLVLENEQMYREFKVDRGRKDHWAMYDCPPKIPVVYIPDPNQPASHVDLKGQKPHANQVQQTLITRPTPQFLTWPNRAPREVNRQSVDFAWGEVQATGGLDGGVAFDAIPHTALTGRSKTTRSKLLKAYGGGSVRFRQSGGERREEMDELLVAIKNTPVNTPVGADPDLDDSVELKLERRSRPLRISNGTLAEPNLDIPMRGISFGRSVAGTQLDDLTDERLQWEMGYELYDVGRSGLDSRAKLRVDGRKMLETETLNKYAFFKSDFQRMTKLGIKARSDKDGLDLALRDAEVELETDSKRRVDFVPQLLDRMSSSSLVQPPAYYGRVSFSNQHNVFTDLPAYAPGLNTTVADREATIDAEALRGFGHKRGRIDPAAKALIDSTRTTAWLNTTVRLGKDHTVDVRHDMQGRYAYERTLPLGLKEVVVCDGTTLWHLYPEIGLGAKRVVTRFHREFLQDIVPDFLLAADELNEGVDVQRLDATTVALTPLRPTSAEEQPKEWLQTHLVIVGNRLTEQQLVLMPTKEVLARITYDGKGKATQIIPKRKDEAKDTETELVQRERVVSTAPNLTPDVRDLVVLPYPLRDRLTTYRALELDANQDLNSDANACYEHLNEESLLKLLACEYATNQGYNIYRIVERCFIEKRDDWRLGFFVLMMATGNDPRNHYYFERLVEKKRTNPLVRYLQLHNDPTVNGWSQRLGFGVPKDVPTDFIGRLSVFRRLQQRWQGGWATDIVYGQRDEERKRALAFAEANAANVLGWCVTTLVQDQCNTPKGWAEVAHTWGVLAEKSGMPYDARYEQARCLGRADQKDDAQKKYQELFRAALADGVLPPLDSSFRDILEHGPQATWAKLMQETATKCATKKARPVVVTLAWQCNQLGDTTLADVLLTYALKDMPKEEKPYTMLTAIHFLQHTGRYDRADQLIRDLLNDANIAKSAQLWRLASSIADNRGDSVRAIECLEKALELEFARMPDVFSVQPIRNDYGRLLAHYEWLASATTTLQVAPPKDLIQRVVKAADRWRTLDQETDHVCDRVAKILRTIGGDGSAELAWDYATTPLAVKPNESAPWLALANTLRQEGRWQLADQCYDMAFQAEPTNAQIVWDRAQYLIQQGQTAQGHELLKTITAKTWQPRFDGVKAQARQTLEGR